MYDIKAETSGLVTNGVSACQGCGLELIMRNVLEALGSDIILIIPPGCAAMFSGSGIEGAVKVAGIQGNLENSAAVATGITNGLKNQGNCHTRVVAIAGDGATLDIGLQALSGAMERNEDIIYICYDNEAYMNTGVQGSSSTPAGASTTTTPGGKLQQSKDLMQIAMAHAVRPLPLRPIYQISCERSSGQNRSEELVSCTSTAPVPLAGAISRQKASR